MLCCTALERGWGGVTFASPARALCNASGALGLLLMLISGALGLVLLLYKYRKGID